MPQLNITGKTLQDVGAACIVAGLRLKDVTFGYGGCGTHQVYLEWPLGSGVTESDLTKWLGPDTFDTRVDEPHVPDALPKDRFDADEEESS